MPEEANPTPNPSITDLPLVESSSRAYLVNGRGSLRNTERILRQDPRTSRELDRTGGLNNLLTRTGNETLERHYLSRFVNYQTSLFIDRVTEGDILRTPTLETLFEQSQENTNISISISTALDSCCAEIQKKLSELTQLVKDEFRRLRRLVIRNAVDLQDQITSNFSRLTDSLLNGLTFIQEKAESYFESLRDSLAEIRQTLIRLLTERFTTLEDIISKTRTDVLERIDSRSSILEGILEENVRSLKTYIEESFSRALVGIGELLTAQGGSIVSSLISYYTAKVLPLLLGISAGVSEVITSTTYISIELGKTLTAINKTLTEVKYLPQDINTLLDKKVEELKKYLSELKSDLIKEVAQEVSLQVVGESYYKWDSISTYYPTITFLFKEQGVSQYARRSQIKLRLPKRNEELTESDIKELRTNCNSILNSTYAYGTQRFNYVSTDKRFKTTVFGSNSSQIKALFHLLFKVISEPFEERNLSITTSRSRINQSRRKTPLGGSEVNTISYTSTFVVKFKKAVLLVNGLKNPIILAES